MTGSVPSEEGVEQLSQKFCLNLLALMLWQKLEWEGEYPKNLEMQPMKELAFGG